MKLTIEPSILDKYNVTLSECLILYLAILKVNIKDEINSLIEKNLVSKDLFSDGNLIVSNEVRELVASIIIDSDKKSIDKDAEFIELAKELQELYPKGRKPGTTYMWRGTTAEIVKKLKTITVKYKCEFTKEQAIKATKTYIQSFNGDYTRMRLLKYFLLKSEKDADSNITINSDFMSLIENEETESNNDWTTTLV